MSTEYAHKPQMVCEKCGKKIEYVVCYDNEKKNKCPKCKKFVDILKCVIKYAGVSELAAGESFKNF